MGTAYRLIGETILPHLDSDAGQRILVAVNQADVAMKGNHWDYEKNLPDETLQKFLEEKVSSIQRRILESNGLQTDPIYYCAGYTDESGEQRRAYNLNKLLLQILRALKSEKVLVLADNINEFMIHKDCIPEGKDLKEIKEWVIKEAHDAFFIQVVPDAAYNNLVDEIIRRLVKEWEEDGMEIKTKNTTL